VLGGNSINDRVRDMGRVVASVTEGTTEIWELRNDNGTPHSFHPHLVHFAVLSIDGRPPPPELAAWKDTLYVPPDSDIRIIARFDGGSDPDTPYMFHCHVLRHEDRGMMGQFVVVEPGEDASGALDTSHLHGGHG
jgi:FtsP/CotA-like multicopper oxidase with cupredoxin domain